MAAGILQFISFFMIVGVIAANTYNINNAYCSNNPGTNDYDTISIDHGKSVTLRYSGDQTGSNPCSYLFKGKTAGLATKWKLCVTPVKYNSSAGCSMDMKYYAFLSMSSTPVKTYDCNTSPVGDGQYCTDKINLLISVSSPSQSAIDVELKITATDLDASGVSGIHSTFSSLVLAGALVMMKLLF